MATSTSLTSSLPALQRLTLHAVALGAVPRARTWVIGLLHTLGARTERTTRLGQDEVRVLIKALADAGWIVEASQRMGFWQVHPTRWVEAYGDLLAQHPVDTLRHALAEQDGLGGLLSARGYDHFPNLDVAIAFTRVSLLGGGDGRMLERLQSACSWGIDWNHLLDRAVLDVIEPTLFPRLHPDLQTLVLSAELVQRNTNALSATPLPVRPLTEALLARPGVGVLPTAALRTVYAEHLTLAGDFDAALATLAPLAAAIPAVGFHGDALRGAQFSHAGRWAGAQAAYEAALAGLRKATEQRKGLLETAIATPYVLALLAQGTPATLQAALKFCLTESGKRQPTPDTAWGVMATAVQMRQGEVRRDMTVFFPQSRAPYVLLTDHWRWLMRAWLTERGDADDLAARVTPAHLAAAAPLRQRLASAGLDAVVTQLDAALQVVQHRPGPATFFVPLPQESWQVALAALAALSDADTVALPSGVSAAETRLWWVLRVSEAGALRDITPMEQKQGARGWGKAKAVPLSRLVKADALPARDAAVARCIRQNAADRSLRIDRAAALQALVGHPHVAWADAPELAVTLVEASPELEVVEHGEHLLVRLQPAPRLGVDEEDDDDVADDDDRDDRYRLRTPRWNLSAAELKEAEALQGLTLLRDEPQRARLIRLSAAQKRVAQLVGHGLTVPKGAAGQLQAVLQGLGAHFQIHADEVQASRELPPDPRLRAELSPQGDGVTLRLVVAPLGENGPRLTPGSGRARLVAAVQGETLGVQRDLAAELSHLETVQDACPMLSPLPRARPGQTVPALWTVEQPDAALALLERLHTLNAVAALDWPKGKAIRVDSAGIGALSVNVTSGNEWLSLQGGVKLNEQLVASLTQLLDWAQSSQSRFVPLGEGRYLALTDELKARLDDLAAVAEAAPKKQLGDLRLAAIAAGWLETSLAGAEVQTDAAFQNRIETLVRAQHWHPKLPATLQAELRPYQFEGYQWAMRLAEAGLGAVLADDMGLGKTLQALAVLLERSAGGPALVLAPTSLIGNWQAEARRFAPSLTVHNFAEAEREALIDAAGPRDVIVVSYQLQQNHAEAFAKRRWHTLVLDEAQAIKNAAAKRSQAAFELGADFRLALSGTPIENRLAELWSIMRVCNPGLLGTLAQFNARFAVPIERDRHRGAQRTLKRLIAPFILRRTKAQVLDDLPPRTELTLHVKGNETEQAHYEALRRQALRDAERAMSADGAGQAHLNVLAQLTKLRRAACDPRLVTPDLQQPGAKVMAFAELARELVDNGHKALVFSQFVDFLALLREPLDAAGIAYQYLDGSTPGPERSKRVAAFQAGEGDLFLISLKAGGFGLNLTVADYVVIADPWWNPAAEDQASGRAHRIGQQRPVTVYRLVHTGTLEEKIVALHADKRELADSVLEADETEGGSGKAAPLKVDELMGLMRAGPSADER
jgi:superfamily II DNA or RNA helicase